MVKPLSVSTLNNQIKALIEANFSQVSVEGEIASVTYHSSGHIYFSIKDEKSTLKCIMWRSNRVKLKFRLEQGEHIVVSGLLSLYSPRGEYQLIANTIEPFGKGTLSLAFEQLKAKLKAKGYFDIKNKKPLPKFPKKIALVTSKNGAALADMLKVAKKRWALVEIIVIDVRVQGEGASLEIAEGIRYADSLGVDIIVISRGGGSVEDLWAFNEEIVADALFLAKSPTLSAVGHEIDFLISDFVADARAPTPSSAMEIILPDSNELLFTLDELAQRFNYRLKEIIDKKQESLNYTKEALNRASIKNRLNLLQDNFKSLKQNFKEAISYRLSRFEDSITPKKEQLKFAISKNITKKDNQLKSIKEAFKQNNPKLKTKEGFAEIIRDSKRVSLEELKVNDSFYLVDSKFKVKVKILEKKLLK